MDSQDVEKVLNLKYEYFSTFIGILFTIGGIWLYIHYFMDRPQKDIFVGLSIVASIFLGFSLFLSGYITMLMSFDRKDRLDQLTYGIDKIEKEQKLIRIKKKYKIKDRVPPFRKLVEKLKKLI